MIVYGTGKKDKLDWGKKRKRGDSKGSLLIQANSSGEAGSGFSKKQQVLVAKWVVQNRKQMEVFCQAPDGTKDRV